MLRTEATCVDPGKKEFCRVQAVAEVLAIELTDKSKLHVVVALRAREFQLTITDNYIDNNNYSYHL